MQSSKEPMELTEPSEKADEPTFQWYHGDVEPPKETNHCIEMIRSTNSWRYNEPYRNLIKQRQENLDGELFIHYVLNQCGIDASLYPPMTMEGLEGFTETILKSPIREVHIHSLLYYILRDWDTSIHQK